MHFGPFFFVYHIMRWKRGTTIDCAWADAGVINVAATRFLVSHDLKGEQVL
jgi:hypothetical protein